MEIAGTTLSAVQTILAALQCQELKEIRSMSDYKSQLDELESTVEAIDSVLCDAAEIKQELLSHQEKRLIDELKDAVFEADDLLDEFVTLAHQKQLLKADGRVSEKVRSFFSLSSNPVSVAYRMSRGVKKIKKKLEAIAYNKQFSFKHDPQPIRIRRPDTCSYVNEADIIGREKDLEKIVGMLLNPDVQQDVSFFTVVGIGGLGKTALAQLVYNDPRVTTAFSLRKWACVADQDQKELDVKEVICKIMGQNFDESSTMDKVQSLVREQLQGKKYLLVLDDVWTEKHIQWHDLLKYLIGGQKGSWIVVTTRSLNTATIVDGAMYELQGLSEENSWRLFELTAFTSNQSSNPPGELVKIGREIVDGCVGVPLAIKVAGSLLYGQDKSKWQSVQEIGLANIRESKNGILPILKLSFHHLESPLKSCFSYCALFPKDFEMEKEKLKSLWMAQGYIVPLDKGQSIEDACEEYFLILLRRCFFQDIKKNSCGKIFSCKIHDLMHDIALHVSGKENLCATDTIRGNLDKNVRHLLVANFLEHDYFLLGKANIRSHLHVRSYIDEEDTFFPIKELVANCWCLRALDLCSLGIKSLPSCIGELLHLRYLDLSYNYGLEVLPKSITKLCNLQTLKLTECSYLRELPKDMSRLVKLRLLDVEKCCNLKYMPKGMGKLSCLHWLSDFMVGGGGSSSSWKQQFDSLEDLKALNKLKDSLNIWIRWPKKDRNIVKEHDDMREGLYLRNKEHLNELSVDFIHEEGDDGGNDDELSLMANMEPHSNLKHLTVKNYSGVKMPGWLALLQNIVTIELYNCMELEYLSCLGNLHHLKSLILRNLAKLEYIKVDDPSSSEISFFPSVEEVKLHHLPKLKGWQRGVVGLVEDNNRGNNLSHQCFSQLHTLNIWNCPELTCLPSCPGLEHLYLICFNEKLQIMNKKRDEVAPSSSSASTSGYEIVNPKLQSFAISNVAWPNSLPSEYFHCVHKLSLWMINEELELPNWIQFLSALQTLNICGCSALKAIPNWMPKFTSLKKLFIQGCSESLKRRCQKDPPGEDWPYIKHISNVDLHVW